MIVAGGKDIFFIVTSFCLFLTLLRSFLCFNKLIQLEYTNYHDEWIKDGEPAGISWRPPGSTVFGSTFATNRVSFVWLFRTPGWIEENPQATATLKTLRAAVLIWNVGALLWIFLFFLVHNQ